MSTMKRNLDPNFVWNCWTWKYRRYEDGYYTHAFDELQCRREHRTVTLCGIGGKHIQDGGILKLHEDGWTPGCIRCRNILRRAGLIPGEV